MNTVEVICHYCRQPFQKKKAHYEYNIRRNIHCYCSRKCQDASRVTRLSCTCAICNKVIQKALNQFKQSKSGKVFCSRHCATIFNNKTLRSGLDHPNFTNGKASYRERAFKCYTVKCELCDYAVKEVLEVHHLDGNRDNNILENLVVLCPTHHTECALGISTITRK